MNSEAKSKSAITKKTIGNFPLISLTVVLVGPMLYQCIKLCIAYYEQPVTTNIDVRDVNQSSFLSKLQFCFQSGNMMNIIKAQSMGLNDSHQIYLQNYFLLKDQKKLIPANLFDNFTNQISFDFYMQRLFIAWSEIESETVRIAQRVINSSNLMEFWNLNQPNNLVAVRFIDGRIIDMSTIVGPYTPHPSWGICYDIPSSPYPDSDDFVQFNFNFSVDRENVAGSAFLSLYIGYGVVFHSNELTKIDYINDSMKYTTYLENWYTVGIKKFIALNRRNKKCVEDVEDNQVFFIYCCDFSCEKILLYILII